MAAFIGIDLGTTFSAVGTIDDTGRPVIVLNKEGKNITPSCVAKDDDGKTMRVGERARRQWGSEPDTAAARFKRDMGSSVTHTIDGEEFTPTLLSSFVLKQLVEDAGKGLGSIGDAVVTIPANFSNQAREETMAAAKMAGLNVKYIINEPTAAALYYAFKNNEDLGGVYAVFDLGGGTFDVSIIRVDGQDIDVIASNGVARLGGDDFDRALIKLVKDKYKVLTGEELDDEDFTINHAEEEKIALSSRNRVRIRVARRNIEVTREEFEEAISSLVSQAQMLCEATIEEAGIDIVEIQEVFLAGGSTRIPVVTQTIKAVFGKEPVASVNVDEVVALGAALYAAYMGDRLNLSAVQANAIKKIQVAEVTGKCFGVISLTHDEVRNADKLVNSVIIRKNEKLPCSETRPFYTIAEGQESVNCRVTESTGPETDPRFVKIIWEGPLTLPPGRPAEQEIRVTFSYDANQIMKCSFIDVATGKKTQIELSMTAASDINSGNIDKFLVE